MKASVRLLGVWAALLALPVAIARNATSCWGSCGVFDDERCSVSEASAVLVLGDSVTQSFMPALAELLRPLGLAPIMPSGESRKGWCGSSHGLRGCLESLVDGRRFAVVYFNWGLHDIKPHTYAKVSRAEYRRNMIDALRLLNATTRSLVFATTTPVGARNAKRGDGDVVELNAVAREVFADTAVLDLYAAVVDECRKTYPGFPEESDCPRMQTDQIHPTAAGQRLLALLAASAILQAAEAPIGEAVINASAASCVRDVRYYDSRARDGKEPRWWIIAIAGAVLIVLAVLAAVLRHRRAIPRPESPTSGVALVPAAALA